MIVDGAPSEPQSSVVSALSLMATSSPVFFTSNQALVCASRGCPESPALAARQLFSSPFHLHGPNPGLRGEPGDGGRGHSSPPGRESPSPARAVQFLMLIRSFRQTLYTS